MKGKLDGDRIRQAGVKIQRKDIKEIKGEAILRDFVWANKDLLDKKSK